jgi:hypothetical protein
MKNLRPLISWTVRLTPVAIALGFLVLPIDGFEQSPKAVTERNAEYAEKIQPLLKKFCLDCHSTKSKKGSLDLERFTSSDEIRKDLKPWQGLIEMLEADEMPPKNKPQPTAEERKALIAWTREFLNAEARARSGDPGHVPLRRLSNAEYNATIRDLTGVDLQPTREFPADGAAGEGFTNAAEALTEISPALLTKYLNAAKEISERAVLLPDGFRFSSSNTRRDWTDESLASLRRFYAAYAPDGNLPLQPYLAATVRHREALLSGMVTIQAIAAKEKLNAKYLGILWETLTSKTPSIPLDQIRSLWRAAKEKDVAGLLAAIKAWQTALWKTVKVGSYVNESTSRQEPNDSFVFNSQTLRFNIKPKPGQDEVVLYLAARDLLSAPGGHVVWHRPRLEEKNKPPLLLRDYSQFGSQYELNFSAIFADTSSYLAAAMEAANDPKLALDDLARKHKLDAAFLKRWIDILALKPITKAGSEEDVPGRKVSAVKLELLDEKAPKDQQKPAINGWRAKGSDLPILIANSSDKTEQVPGRISPHHVAVHPTPKEFVAATWKSPIEGRVGIAAKIAHAHPACGNGVAWWLEHRRGNAATIIAEGLLDLGKEIQLPAKEVKLAKGDIILLAVDARDGNHVCDLTEIALTITEREKPNRVWDLGTDIANTVLDGNPHADRQGNKEVWSFVRGPAKAPGSITGNASKIPGGTVLDRWRDAASNPAKRDEASRLAVDVQKLLSSPQPVKDKDPDRILYDLLVSFEGPLFNGFEIARLSKIGAKSIEYGLKKERFGQHPQGKSVEQASLVVPVGSITEIRLPAALLSGREFVVEGQLDGANAESLVQFQILQSLPNQGSIWDGTGTIVTSKGSATHKKLLQGFEEFRNCFPLYICYPHIVPLDEVVCLKLYHREDEPLKRLFLSAEASQKIDRLWEEHRFISHWPVTEHKNLPLFIGFVTQDQPKELVTYFEGKREPFRLRAEAFERDLENAAPKQLEKLLEFAARAFRRPLSAGEKTQLSDLYQQLRKKGSPHDEAFRGVLARVLVSPAFLFRIEHPPAGKEPGPVNDWELATRLSYFLWSSVPDEELSRIAAAGQLRDPKVFTEQTLRMLKDERIRSLAIEFGTQWIHVRGFDELKEKNEKLFPTFDAKLRQAMYEESILFFQDLFQSDRGVLQILDADYTFLNERLAKHYGIPGVSGEQWRRFDGVKKYGRGGILGLASVQSKQAGASRTSPVLRGNWVVETLLGEKLPRPPANVPRLPEEEGGADGLTVRQLVEKHAKAAECAVCHQRIDPFGFALEKYDPIGRLREKEIGGLAIETAARLKDGTEFVGIDGLRNYLLTRKKDVFVRLFCRRLLGYALGRETTLSDQLLIDQMLVALNKNDGKLSAAIMVIVQSPQFRSIRGSDFDNKE